MKSETSAASPFLTPPAWCSAVSTYSGNAASHSKSAAANTDTSSRSTPYEPAGGSNVASVNPLAASSATPRTPSTRAAALGRAETRALDAEAHDLDVARDTSAAISALAVADAAPADPAATVDREIAAAALFATFAFAFFAGAEPSVAAEAGAALDHDATAQLWQVAGGEVPFWANMVKYARFSISIMVGFAFMFGRPIVNLLKKPQTAVLVFAGGYGGYKFFRFTIETMLGMNDDMTLNY